MHFKNTGYFDFNHQVQNVFSFLQIVLRFEYLIQTNFVSATFYSNTSLNDLFYETNIVIKQIKHVSDSIKQTTIFSIKVRIKFQLFINSYS